MITSARQNDEQDAIDREASAWLVRIEEDGLNRKKERDFRRWLADDPRHQLTYDAMRSIWSDVALMPGLAELAPTTDHVHNDVFPRPAHARRWIIGVAAAVSLAAGVALFLGRPDAADRQYRTGLAQTRSVTLPDGSTVTLGARSSITIAYQPTERRVILSSGEALFDVAHNSRRPFVVEAGPSLVRDLGTKFDVNRSASSIRIGVIEGQVQVSTAADTNASRMTISGGEAVQVIKRPIAFASGTISSAGEQILVASQQAPGAWREGRLVFDNVPLADLSSDINRYYGPGVTLAGATVGQLRITASFKTSEIPAFIGALDTTLPVRIEHTPNGGFRITDARR